LFYNQKIKKMTRYNKSDMVYKDYSWTAIKGDDPKITGEPDSTLFNRHEGYEVLYMINKCMVKWEFHSVSSGQKIEKMIRLHLPSDTRSQKNVYDWLDRNYNNY